MSERDAMNRNLVELSRQGLRMFRNNVGKSWISNVAVIVSKAGVVNVQPGDVVLRRARRINFGLFKGSGDLIGWSPVIITADMIGSIVAVFTSAEQKIKNRKRKPEQTNWDTEVRRSGGISMLLED